MTNKEAITILDNIDKSIAPYSRWWRWGYKKAIKLAMQSLEKQIPKKIGQDRQCPNCKKIVFCVPTVGKKICCCNCGQLILWED